MTPIEEFYSPDFDANSNETTPVFPPSWAKRGPLPTPMPDAVTLRVYAARPYGSEGQGYICPGCGAWLPHGATHSHGMYGELADAPPLSPSRPDALTLAKNLLNGTGKSEPHPVRIEVSLEAIGFALIAIAERLVSKADG